MPEENFFPLPAFCRKCGRSFQYLMARDVYFIPSLREAELQYALCPECSHQQREEEARRAVELRIQEQEQALAADYSRRYRESNLAEYALDYDPNHPHANPELDRWISENRYRSLWIAGRTGLCKSRLLQKYAREMLKTRSVQYWASFDLLAMLSSRSKEIEPLMRRLYSVDLLIIDDLGKEIMTPAKSKYLFNLIDRRRIGFEIARRRQNDDDPEFRFLSRERRTGAQLWVSTNDNGSGLLSGFSPQDGPAVLRRLSEMCKLYEKF